MVVVLDRPNCYERDDVANFKTKLQALNSKTLGDGYDDAATALAEIESNASQLTDSEKMERGKVLCKEIVGDARNSEDNDLSKSFFTVCQLRRLLELNRLFESLPILYRRSLTESEMLGSKLIDLVTDATIYLDHVEKLKFDGFDETDAAMLLYCFISTASDSSPSACTVFLDKGLIGVLIKNISSEKNKKAVLQENKRGSKADYSCIFTSFNLCLIHNIAKLPESQQRFAAVDAVEAISYYFNAECETIQISALSAVACILDESKVSSTCLCTYGIIGKLVNCLAKSLETVYPHFYLGFSAEELVESLTFLAVNDDNKRQIVENGALDLLIGMMSSPCSTEQMRAFECLWALSFDEAIRKHLMSNPKCIENLEKVYRTAMSAESRLKAQRAMEWIKHGKEGLQAQIKKCDKGGDDVTDGGRKAKKGHIFISYCWKHQDIILRLKDALVFNGYKVWIDVEALHGSTLEAMAQGVEDAGLVLMCYSENYKQSNNCRAEAEYLYNIKKPFIPINMQYQYKPTGWLGLIVGAKLYVDFSLEEVKFDVAIKRLLAEVQGMYGPGDFSRDMPDTPRMPPTPRRKSTEKMPEAFSFHQPDQPLLNSERLQSIKNWSNNEVLTWFGEQGLENLSTNKTFSNFDGKAIYGLFVMSAKAPKLYYKRTLRLLNNSMIDCLHLTTALESLA